MHFFSASIAAFLATPFIFIASLLGLQAHVSTGPSQAPTTTEPVACTMEAKLCPDGSYVGRTGPNCAFAPCPEATSTAPAAAPVIYSITPSSGPIGTEMTIDGFGFSADNTVHFGYGTVVHVVASSGGPAIMCARGATNCHSGVHQRITVAIPSVLTPACYYATPRCLIASRGTAPGTYDVSVSNEHGSSNAETFTVTP